MRRVLASRWMAASLMTVLVAGIAVALSFRAGSAALTQAGPITDRPVPATEGRALARAEQLLVQGCMRRAGFRYWTVESPEPTPTRHGGIYVGGDLAWAGRHGYGTDLERQQQRAARRDPNSRYFAGLTPARQQAMLVALNGPSPQGLHATLPNGIRVQHSDRGCSSAAQRQLYGDLAAWFQTTKLVENLAGERYGLVVQDPAFTAAVTAWSGCMRQRGHKVDSPADTHGRYADPATAPSRDSEITVAVDEARCAATSGLADTAERLDARYTDVQNHRYRAALAERRQLQRAALPRAMALVGAAARATRPAVDDVGRMPRKGGKEQGSAALRAPDRRELRP